MKIKNNAVFYCIAFLLFITSCGEGTRNGLSLWYEQPATEWMQASPVGNGRLGAMIYGGIETEIIALNEITLWAGQNDENQNPSVGKEKLAEVRKLFFEGKIAEGNDLSARYFSSRSASFGTHLPMGDLKIKFNHATENVSNYKRELDIEKSITTVSYKTNNIRYNREYICSNPDDVMLIRLTADSKNALNFEVSLDLLRKSEVTAEGNFLSFSGQAIFHNPEAGGVHYLGNINVSLKEGTISSTENTLVIENSNEVIIAIDIRTDYNSPSYKERCAQTIKNATSKSYEEIKQAHINDYTSLYNRVDLFLGASELDKLPTDVRWKQLKEQGNDDPGLFTLFFQYGRYLLISSSRENSPLPANLQGVWNDNLACNMGWTCDYHLDINTQQNYWLSNVGNLHECNVPLFNYIEDLSIHGEKTANIVFGSPGWTAHTVANAWGYTAPGNIYWGMFTTAGAWMATHLWSHYEYTQDTEYLKNKAYPLLKKTALFFLDYMVEDPNSGYLVTGPSISPENSFLFEGRNFTLSMMPTVDRVLVYDILHSCIESSKILGVDIEFRQEAEAALAKLPPLKIGKDGTIQEWFEDFELAQPNHRHSSHLISLYPLYQITPEQTPELAEAAAKSVYRQLNSENWEDVEWSRANMICFYARLKNAEEAYKNMKGLLIEFSRENLFTMAPAGIAGAESDIFEYDANSAGPAAMAEMLIQSHEGYIEFLPTLPKEWNTGSFNGLCVRGGAEVDLKWSNGLVQQAKITATIDNTFSVKIPANMSSLKITKNGKPLDVNVENERIAFNLNKGEYVELK